MADVGAKAADFVHPRLMAVVLWKQFVHRFPRADIGNDFVRVDLFAISGLNSDDAGLTAGSLIVPPAPAVTIKR